MLLELTDATTADLLVTGSFFVFGFIALIAVPYLVFKLTLFLLDKILENKKNRVKTEKHH